MPWLRVVDSFFFKFIAALNVCGQCLTFFARFLIFLFRSFFFYSADQEQAREAAAKAEAEAKARLAYLAVFCVCVCVLHLSFHAVVAGGG